MLHRRDLLAGSVALALVGSTRGALTARYPQASGLPGAPFADTNLKLAILSGLLDKGLIDLGTPQELAQHVLGRTVDLEKEGYDPIPAVREYLDGFPLTLELLDQVDALVLDGGNTIYRYVWFFWDGEDNSFDLRSLAGIDHCPNIKSLDLTSMIAAVDLLDLLPPFKVEHITAGVKLQNIPALLNMPSLQSVRILDDQLYAEVTTPGHPNRRVMDALKAKGVAVWVHWVSSDEPGPPAFQ